MLFVDKMLANKYLKLLRAVNLSKNVVIQSVKQPQLVQTVIKIKAEKSFDPINNLILLLSLSSFLKDFAHVPSLRKKSL